MNSADGSRESFFDSGCRRLFAESELLRMSRWTRMEKVVRTLGSRSRRGVILGAASTLSRDGIAR